jgi:anti-sigma regulatory factor (Ser/Thr protein kinase)
LRCDRSAPARAREALRQIDGIDPVCEDALLVTSELVSNAVLHSGCDPQEEIELVADRVPAGIRIEVADAGRSGRTPRVKRADDGSPGGIGLRLVHALARRWGADRQDGVRVWAELAI